LREELVLAGLKFKRDQLRCNKAVKVKAHNNEKRKLVIGTKLIRKFLIKKKDLNFSVFLLRKKIRVWRLNLLKKKIKRRLKKQKLIQKGKVNVKLYRLFRRLKPKFKIRSRKRQLSYRNMRFRPGNLARHFLTGSRLCLQYKQWKVKSCRRLNSYFRLNLSVLKAAWLHWRNFFLLKKKKKESVFFFFKIS